MASRGDIANHPAPLLIRRGRLEVLTLLIVILDAQHVRAAGE
jgi:hypothetical protein